MKAALALAIVSLVPAALPAVAAVPHHPDCPPSDLAYCVVVDLSDALVDCTSGEIVRCRLTASVDLRAFALEPLPGEAAWTATVDFIVCARAGPCRQETAAASGGCAWTDGGGCATTAPLEFVIDEPGDGGCVFASTLTRAHAGAGPATAAPLARDADSAAEDHWSAECA